MKDKWFWVLIIAFAGWIFCDVDESVLANLGDFFCGIFFMIILGLISVESNDD
jgi:hypothetical protein